ncbi:MAG: 4a-hydroxytetrahydrobiopterin dehydratase [Bacteroidetes bacterium]|jgi:4a-hydroxytetrahydrobiopterin dehydratase|nr:4a-hydroxytetrahydrobiopterin dehydratase [Bacteroidota bacterium]
MQLKEMTCEPIELEQSAMNPDDIKKYLKKMPTGWKVVENKLLRKEYPFLNFKQSMAFANDVATIAEKENHHPQLNVSPSEVEIEISTHALNGLTPNDFILAAKIDDL